MLLIFTYTQIDIKLLSIINWKLIKLKLMTIRISAVYLFNKMILFYQVFSTFFIYFTLENPTRVVFVERII